jgi:ABC-type transporter Mla maintaining outer membrane lipid asymmetry ATPase subunit MlaF
VVTHELSSINIITDKAVMLADGKVLATGTLDEVRANSDPVVQGFFRREVPPHEPRPTLIDQLEWRA